MKKEKKNHAGVAIPISNKINFRMKGHHKRQQRLLHNTKGIDPTRKYDLGKHICTQYICLA